MTQAKSSFSGKVALNAQKSPRAQRGYLDLPEGISSYSIEPNTDSIVIDMLPYVVSDPKHPDFNDRTQTAVVGSLWYKRPIMVHREVGQDNETCICPRTVGLPCPICDYQKKRYKEGATVDEVKTLYPKPRNLYIVMPEGDDNIYVWDMAHSLLQDTINRRLLKNPDFEIFPDLKEGYSLEIPLKWNELGKNVFPEASYINFLKREPFDEALLDEVPDLDKILIVLSYKELSAKFFEIDVEDAGRLHDTEEVEPETQVPETSRRRGKRTPVEEPPAPEVHQEITQPPAGTRSPRRYAAATTQLAETEPRETHIERHGPARGSHSAGPVVAPKAVVGTCPSGFVFGVDTDKYDACDTCTVWKPCTEAKEAHQTA